MGKLDNKIAAAVTSEMITRATGKRAVGVIAPGTVDPDTGMRYVVDGYNRRVQLIPADYEAGDPVTAWDAPWIDDGIEEGICDDALAAGRSPTRSSDPARRRSRGRRRSAAARSGCG